MRRSAVWAALLLTVAALTSGCTFDGEAYPNDQDLIKDRLSDAGLDVTVEGIEELTGSGQESSVTISYSTSAGDSREKDLATIRRVVWDQYPHDLAALRVDVSTYGQGVEDHYYTREQLEDELGRQQYREDDSEPRGSPVVVAVTAGVLVLLATFAYVTWRVWRKETPPPDAPAVSHWPPQPRLMPRSGYPIPQQPAPPPVREPVPTPPPLPVQTPELLSEQPDFDKTRNVLNDSWQYLAALPPNPPRKKPRAEFGDEWLARHSGVPVEKITAARKARNDAIHRVAEINLRTMRDAIDILNDVHKGLSEALPERDADR
jgi:hypothetical protein